MFITFRKWTVYYLFCLIALVVAFALITQEGESVQTTASFHFSEQIPVLVIDPGHGGEDGGAVASDGTVESHINLSIASTTADLARLLGWKIVMTRDEDISIHDSSAKTLREKKVSDLKNRAQLCNSIENAILVSIHQNSIPAAKNVQGAQVFYNEITGSYELAQEIQTILNQTLNSGHTKESKQMGSNNYLMRSVEVPAVLIECGFLSNEAETQLLKTPEYQLKLSLCIVASVTNHFTVSEK